MRIVDEGLSARSTWRAGGKLAADLRDLYSYLAMRLTHANLHNDDAALDECGRLIDPVRQAWASIASQVDCRCSRRPDCASYAPAPEHAMNTALLNYYEAIEKASQDMLEAARSATGTTWSSSRARARC